MPVCSERGASMVRGESNHNGLDNWSIRVTNWQDLASAHALCHPGVSCPEFTEGCKVGVS